MGNFDSTRLAAGVAGVIALAGAVRPGDPGNLSAMKVLRTPLVVEVPSHYENAPLVIENITLLADTPGQTAITLRWPASPSIAQTTVFLRNVCIKPGKTGWANGIHLVNAWNAVLDGVNIYGGMDGALKNGIILDGQSMDVRIDAATIVHPVTGVFITGESEGAQLTHLTVLGAVHGIYADTPVAEAGLFVSSSHLAASRAGVVLHNRPQAFLRDLLIYQHPWRAAADFDGVQADGVSRSAIHQANVEVRFPHRSTKPKGP